MWGGVAMPTAALFVHILAAVGVFGGLVAEWMLVDRWTAATGTAGEEAARRAFAVLPRSIAARGWVAVGVVFVMTARPALVPSVLVPAAAAAMGAL